MELLIGVGVAFGLLYLLGVEAATLLGIVQLLLTLFTALSMLFFFFCDILLLLGSKKYPARLLYIQKPEDRAQNEKEQDKPLSKFAFYLVEGEKLRNWFPAETLMSKKIYEQEDCFVRIAKIGKRRMVFDRHSVFIVIAGTVLMSAATLLMTAYCLIVLGAI